MRLYLIRHGETVDNVANLYAGSRDSELTNHGVQQATRLGQYFATTSVQFTHTFSSQLKRAVKTAELIRVAQPQAQDGEDGIVVAQYHELAEQDFGSYEGVSFLARQPGSNVSGKNAHRALHKDDPDFVDVESKEAMARRIDVFLDSYLVPVVNAAAVSAAPCVVAIVSHGILLARLWQRLLQRLPPRSVTLHPEVSTRYSSIDLERIGGWSNTGYLELELEIAMDATTTATVEVAGPVPTKSIVALPLSSDAQQSMPGTSNPETDPQPPAVDGSDASAPKPTSLPPGQILANWKIIVHAVNSRQHLTGLKRTGGGVGSARHDDKQKSIETFFKRRKVE